MSLLKLPDPTPARIVASQSNGRKPERPATPEDMERLRDVNARHGFYSQAESEARIVDCRLSVNDCKTGTTELLQIWWAWQDDQFPAASLAGGGGLAAAGDVVKAEKRWKRPNEPKN